MANQQAVRDLNKTRQKLSKLQGDFDEEKFINKQLLDNQQQLTNEMKEKNKDIEELREQQNDLIVHITGGEKIKIEATEDELKTSKITITAKSRDRRRQ